MSRPKRKATINKSYNDTTDYSSFEEKSKKPKVSSETSKKSASNSTVSSSNGSPKNGSTQDNTSEKVPEVKRPKFISNTEVPTNWQPAIKPVDYFSNKLNLQGATLDLKTKTLTCPNQPYIPMNYEEPPKKKRKFKLTKGDYIYMISEPPGEPYYIGQIMAFKSRKQNDLTTPEKKKTISGDNLKNYQFQIQWFYRPRDISKSSGDSRLLFASMHSDTCPLQSFRGTVTVKNRLDIESFDDYVKLPNHFYFEKLYDRYMMKFYDVLSTARLLNISQNQKSQNFLKALNKRFLYIFVEPTMTKFLVKGFTSDSCTCEKCGQWCSTQDSVNCADCKTFYHMYCLEPPLLKKPSRGFSWHCEGCTKKHLQEQKNKRILMLGHDNKLSNEKELTSESSDDQAREDEDEEEETTIKSSSDLLPKYELMAIEFLKNDQLTFDERRLAEEWCMRYLGVHTRLEDGVDLEDRSPYPRASTRIGAKHQATHIPEYEGHPIIYYDSDKAPVQVGRKLNKKKKQVEIEKPLPLPKEFEDVDPQEYPEWLQPRPKGYVERGVDNGIGENIADQTCELLWKPSDSDIKDDFEALDAYRTLCAPIAEKLGISPNTPNFIDKILYNYFINNGDVSKAKSESDNITKASLKEPILSKEEVKRFEEGVRKYGSELHPVTKAVRTVPFGSIVRFYYIWKKTPNGRQIWGNFEGRLRKKVQNVQNDTKANKTQGDDDDDDSSYETENVPEKTFVCKYCEITSSIHWYRISGAESGSNNVVTGLCIRCAKLWRRYAIVWEDPLEVERRVLKTGKKKIEYELLRDSDQILSEAGEDGLLTDSKKKPTKAGPRKRVSPVPSSQSPKKPKVETKVAAPVKTEKVALKVEQKPKKKPVVKQESTEIKVKTNQAGLKTPETTPEVLEPFEVTELIIPNLNEDYETPDEFKLVASEPDTKGDIEQVKSLLADFTANKLYSVIPISSVAPRVDRKLQHCSICGQNDAVDDILICGLCNISVHSTCCAIDVPDRIKPLDTWLCDCCTNDVNPTYETNYSCQLCNSLSGYLKPVIDSGKWVHITCFIASFKNVKTRQNYLPDPETTNLYVKAIKKSKNALVISKLKIELTTPTFEIKSIEMGDNQKCAKCDSAGILVPCEVCNIKFHPKCHQDFKFGFKRPKQGVKGATKLEPSFYCWNHNNPSVNFFKFRGASKRGSNNKGQTTYIQLFLDEIIKRNSKSPDPKLRHVKYMTMLREVVNFEYGSSKLPKCSTCGTDFSPVWKPTATGPECLNCTKKEPPSSEVPSNELKHIFNESINASQFQIDDENDVITNNYHPPSLDELKQAALALV